jgi:hypothetical protein
MDFELISADEFDNLPEDDVQCFVDFEAICRRNMTRMINNDTSTNFDRSVQAQYMAAVSSVAVECGIPHLSQLRTIESDNEFYENFSRFSLDVQGEVARIRIRGRRSRGSLSVQLTDNTRTIIQHYVSRLREIIDASDLPAARKAAMQDKLNDLIEELEKRRLNLGKTMFVLSMVMANLAGATTIAAEGPAAVTHIMRLIGVDKESEELALSRLTPPSKALSAPRQKPAPPQNKPAPSWDTARGGDLDDEIPF